MITPELGAGGNHRGLDDTAARSPDRGAHADTRVETRRDLTFRDIETKSSRTERFLGSPPSQAKPPPNSPLAVLARVRTR